MVMVKKDRSDIQGSCSTPEGFLARQRNLQTFMGIHHHCDPFSSNREGSLPHPKLRLDFD